jgi:hypothetical protein
VVLLFRLTSVRPVPLPAGQLRGLPFVQLLDVRVVGVQFGSDGSAFDAIAPKMYFIGEKAKAVDDLDENFW